MIEGRAALPSDPTEIDVEYLPVIGCSNLVCTHCATAVRARPRGLPLARRARAEYTWREMHGSGRPLSLLVTLCAIGCGGSTSSATNPSSTGGAGGQVVDSGGGGSGGTVADSGAIITGSACASNEACGPGYMCNLEAPGGYCMQGSPGGPTACHEPDAPCTVPGAICSPLPWHQISGVCLRACASQADCRPNQICAVVVLFPGEPNSPQSPAKVCWTACQPGMDQSCNDNPMISSLHGACEADGTCTCKPGYAKNPETGRCL